MDLTCTIYQHNTSESTCQRIVRATNRKYNVVFRPQTISTVLLEKDSGDGRRVNSTQGGEHSLRSPEKRKWLKLYCILISKLLCDKPISTSYHRSLFLFSQLRSNHKWQPRWPRLAQWTSIMMYIFLCFVTLAPSSRSFENERKLISLLCFFLWNLWVF